MSTPTSTSTSTNPPTSLLPTKVAILIFPGFQLLDYAGPLDALNILSLTHPLTLYTLASTLSPVSTQQAAQITAGSPSFSQTILPTHTFATAPSDIDVLIIPGGMGSRDEKNRGALEEQVEWLKGLGLGGGGGGGGGQGVKWVLTVCTGSEILARTGVLGGRRATTNKRAFNEVSRGLGSYFSCYLPKAMVWVGRCCWCMRSVGGGLRLRRMFRCTDTSRLCSPFNVATRIGLQESSSSPIPIRPY